MKSVVLSLLSSRKFVVTVLAVLVMAGFVLCGQMPASSFLSSVEKLTAVLVAMIGAEGVADRWNSPPPGTVNVPINPPGA